MDENNGLIYGTIVHYGRDFGQPSDCYDEAMLSRDDPLLNSFERLNPDVLCMIVIDGFAIPLVWIDYKDSLRRTANSLHLEDGTKYPIKDMPVPRSARKRTG
jgi:hypothetical protein